MSSTVLVYEVMQGGLSSTVRLNIFCVSVVSIIIGQFWWLDLAAAFGHTEQGFWEFETIKRSSCGCYGLQELVKPTGELYVFVSWLPYVARFSERSICYSSVVEEVIWPSI